MGSGYISYGSHFWISQPTPWGNSPGCLYANVIDTSGSSHSLASTAGAVAANQWSHVAVTYSSSSGYAYLYVNGSQAANAYLGSFTPQTSYDLYLGARVCGAGAARWSGGLDEMTLYNGQLNIQQLGAIYQAGAAGKSSVGPPTVYLTNYMSWQDRTNGTTNGVGTQSQPFWGDFDSIVGQLTAPNQTIILGPGTFFTSGSAGFTLKQGQCLEGDPAGTVLQLLTPPQTSGYVIKAVDNNVCVQNLTIECDTNQANNITNYSVGGVVLDGDNCVVSGVTVLHHTAWYNGGGEKGAFNVGTPFVTANNVVEGCTVEDCAGDDAINGIWFFGGGLVQNNSLYLPYTPNGLGGCQYFS